MEINMKKLIAWLVILAFILLSAWVIYLLGGINAVWMVGAFILALLGIGVAFSVIVGSIWWAVGVITGKEWL
jgi:hypothetical protein